MTAEKLKRVDLNLDAQTPAYIAAFGAGAHSDGGCRRAS